MTAQADLQRFVAEAVADISQTQDLDQLKIVRLAHAGDKSPIAGQSRLLGSLPADQKASMGKIIGEAKATVAHGLSAQRDELGFLQLAHLGGLGFCGGRGGRVPGFSAGRGLFDPASRGHL